MSAIWGGQQTRQVASGRFVTVLAAMTLLATVLVVWTSRGPGYLEEDCASYVAVVNHHPRYGAKIFFDGKAPGYRLLANTMLATAAEGDVAAFHGVHVAVFHDGRWHDSDPQHDGPGLMKYDPRDPWFHGETRIYRRTR